MPCEVIDDVQGDLIVMPFLKNFLQLGPYSWSLGTAFEFLERILDASISPSTLSGLTPY